MNKIAFLVGFYLLFVEIQTILLKKFVKCLEFLDIRIPEPQKNSLVIFVFFVSLLFFKSK